MAILEPGTTDTLFKATTPVLRKAVMKMYTTRRGFKTIICWLHSCFAS